MTGSRALNMRARSRASSGQTVSEFEHLSSNDEHENQDDSGIGLGVQPHRRQSNHHMPTASAPTLQRILQQQQRGSEYGYT